MLALELLFQESNSSLIGISSTFRARLKCSSGVFEALLLPAVKLSLSVIDTTLIMIDQWRSSGSYLTVAALAK